MCKITEMNKDNQTIFEINTLKKKKNRKIKFEFEFNLTFFFFKYKSLNLFNFKFLTFKLTIGTIFCLERIKYI